MIERVALGDCDWTIWYLRWVRTSGWAPAPYRSRLSIGLFGLLRAATRRHARHAPRRSVSTVCARAGHPGLGGGAPPARLTSAARRNSIRLCIFIALHDNSELVPNAPRPGPRPRREPPAEGDYTQARTGPRPASRPDARPPGPHQAPRPRARHRPSTEMRPKRDHTGRTGGHNVTSECRQRLRTA